MKSSVVCVIKPHETPILSQTPINVKHRRKPARNTIFGIIKSESFSGKASHFVLDVFTLCPSSPTRTNFHRAYRNKKKRNKVQHKPQKNKIGKTWPNGTTGLKVIVYKHSPRCAEGWNSGLVALNCLSHHIFALCWSTYTENARGKLISCLWLMFEVGLAQDGIFKKKKTSSECNEGEVYDLKLRTKPNIHLNLI